MENFEMKIGDDGLVTQIIRSTEGMIKIGDIIKIKVHRKWFEFWKPKWIVEEVVVKSTWGSK